MSGRIITLAQQKGGSGKTTVASHLAIAHALRGLSVAILDVDPQGSLGEWFEARETTLGPEGTGLTFRTASGWGARREARALARDHAIVVVDTPPKSDMEARPAIEAADLVCIPVQPTPVDLWATQATLEMLSREKRPGLMILNRAVPRAALTQEISDVVRGLPVPTARTTLGSRVAFAAAMGKGLSVEETEPGSRSAEEIAALIAEVMAAGA
ncbi:ParA family partition ATPase [Segnochrobactraceae bacterium EtOH-i3]